jgi:hypothetical protein
MVTGAGNSSTVLERKERKRSLPTRAGGSKWIILPSRGPKFIGAGMAMKIGRVTGAGMVIGAGETPDPVHVKNRERRNPLKG